MPIQYALRAALLLPLLSGNAAADDASDADTAEISEITVTANRVANDRPAGTYESTATALRFDPLTELQSRGIAEGQSDVTVRGGLFENTGFMLGAMTIMDPQTGHYVAELPVDPALVSTPAIYKSIDSAVAGFNSSVATVSYGFQRVEEGGDIAIGAGSDDLNFQSFRMGHVSTSASGNEIGVAVSAARSEGDGSVAFGDHKFVRANVQVQILSDMAQTDFLVAYQDKFFGWPGAYTGFASLPEIDDSQTTLLVANHRREFGENFFEAGAYYRRLVDDYDFNRTNFETGAPGSFEHETQVVGAGFQGSQRSGRVTWRYGGQLTADKLVRSTDLTNGTFTDRAYATLSVVPSVETELASGNKIVWRFGATYDFSNRDDQSFSPLLGVTFRQENSGGSLSYSLEYAATSQVPGYTALKSNPTGLFGGNADLGREKAKQLSASIEKATGDWQFRVTAFSRRDDDLVDWTYASGAPFARQANSVDMDVTGIEGFVVRSWESVDLSFGYTALDKDADYGTAQVDASFYALNFAKHRATLAVAYQFGRGFELRLDNEYRIQEDNPLRSSDDSTYLASASLVWASSGDRRFGAALVADNLTDSEYQPFPGTPASGRQISLSASYSW